MSAPLRIVLAVGLVAGFFLGAGAEHYRAKPEGTKTVVIERTFRPTTTCSPAVCPQMTVETRTVP